MGAVSHMKPASAGNAESVCVSSSTRSISCQVSNCRPLASKYIPRHLTRLALQYWQFFFDNRPSTTANKMDPPTFFFVNSLTNSDKELI